MSQEPDLNGVHVWSGGRPVAGFAAGPNDTRPLPPVPPVRPPAARSRRRSRAPLVVAGIFAVAVLGAGSTAAFSALTSDNAPTGGTNLPADQGAAPQIGQSGTGTTSSQQGTTRLRIRGGGDDGHDGSRERGDD